MFGHPDYRAARLELLEQLSERGMIDAPSVLAAMARVPRERFVPEEVRHLAYVDRALPIACGQTISQPYIVALMTAALQLTGSERVLEIGTGSGYQAAVLAELAAEVVSVERHAALSQAAQTVLDELGYSNIRLVVGDGTLGWPAGAPYDRIVVTAAAAQIPPALEEQLAEGGTLVIPVGPSDGQTLAAYHKIGGKLYAEALSGCRFVPLVGAQGEPSAEVDPGNTFDPESTNDDYKGV